MTLTAPAPSVERDRYGRPGIYDESGKRTWYTRATTVAETLDDRFNLELWKCRQVADGLSRRPDLLAMVSAKREDKQAMNGLVSDAMEAAASGAAANLGTALHALAEIVDRGQDPGEVPEQLKADLDAYRKATDGWTWTHVEQMTVIDDLRIAGTPDRVGYRRAGKVIIADLKTGDGALTFGQTSIAAQLAIYAHARAYDLVTHERSDLDVDLEHAMVIHVPVGSGEATLHVVDIAAGWEAVQHSTWTRAWRKRKDLITPLAAS